MPEMCFILMNNYILAENLKHKHSFLMKLLFIAPMIALLHAFALMPLYFTVNAYNWWVKIEGGEKAE